MTATHNKQRFIDLSQTFEDGMPGFRMKNDDGILTPFSARVRPFLTHEQSRPRYDHQAEFEITEMTFQTSIGTYLDSPYHRFRDRRDIAALELNEVILPGVVVDARGRNAWEAVSIDVLPSDVSLEGKAVLFNFGWDVHWGTEAYYAYPFIARDLIDHLVNAGAKLVGMDTLNADDTHVPSRPAHSEFLSRDILIVENLCHLERLHGQDFRFFAVPWKAKGVAALPVRAFAEIV